ncbi:hypothetical protein ANN_22221 [Periplaneta americana]|uniref:Uncharacterized protein n=1 Tax=Periplaneta americana TaxID=6978 RepID=A0ABQ8S7U5_PERAM|nr:hypothetical protein ANN_22221 [Periplaneta americana]
MAGLCEGGNEPPDSLKARDLLRVLYLTLAFSYIDGAVYWQHVDNKNIVFRHRYVDNRSNILVNITIVWQQMKHRFRCCVAHDVILSHPPTDYDRRDQKRFKDRRNKAFFTQTGVGSQSGNPVLKEQVDGDGVIGRLVQTRLSQWVTGSVSGHGPFVRCPQLFIFLEETVQTDYLVLTAQRCERGEVIGVVGRVPE